MDGRHQAVLRVVQLFGEHRHVGVAVAGLAQPVVNVVEVLPPRVEPEFHQERRPDYGDMVIEGIVQPLRAAGCQLVTVHIQHKGEYLQDVVLHNARHGHIVNVRLLFVLEHQEFGNFGELLAVLQGKVFPGDAHHPVNGRFYEVHERVNLRCGRQLAVQVSGKGGEHGHDGVYGREQGNHFFRRNVHQIKVEPGLDVLLGTGGIEALEVNIAHVGRRYGIGHLQGALAHGNVHGGPVYQEAVVFDTGRFQREIHLQVPGNHNEFASGAVRQFRGVHVILQGVVRQLCRCGLVGGIVCIGPH